MAHIHIQGGTDNILLLQSVFTRYNMFPMSNSYSQRDQLTLSNAHLYLSEGNIDPFVFFANNVAIKQDLTFSEEGSLERLTEAIVKAFTVYGIKLVAPLRTLSMRILEANHGFLELHTTFLRVCKALYTPADALPVVEYPGMFKHLRRPAQAEFLVEACDICLQLGRYPAAYEFAVRAVRVEERPTSAIKRLLILSIYMRKSVKEFEEIISRTYTMLEGNIAVASGPAPLGKKQQEWADELRKRQKDLYFYSLVCGVREFRKLKEEEEFVLAEEGLLDVFKESEFTSLRSYIESDVKGLNWRIKASEVKGTPVGKLQVARGVNQLKEVYKYDSQERIMYFNHRSCGQEQLNQLITKAFLMQNEANNCRIERKELDMGRMGGLGGLGGLGLGGFGGGMGFGSMMGSGGKKRRGDTFDFQ